MDASDYTKYTQGMQVGDTIKVPHIGCTESNAMRVTEAVEGTKFYCFKCATYHFESSFNSPRERLRRQKSMEANQRIRSAVTYELPEDFSRNIPVMGLVWLGNGGWTSEMIERYNIGYSESLTRVILPVTGGGYTARSVETWLKPKYLEKVPPNAVWESEQEFSCVTITEDILSAGRVGVYTKGISILGTSMSTAFLNRLKNYTKINVWLDPDKGGVDGLKGMIKRIRLVNDNVRIIKSDVDPKNVPENELEDILCTDT